MPSHEIDHLKFRVNYAEMMIGSLFYNGHIDYNYEPNDKEYVTNCINLYINYLGK